MLLSAPKDFRGLRERRLSQRAHLLPPPRARGWAGPAGSISAMVHDFDMNRRRSPALPGTLASGVQRFHAAPAQSIQGEMAPRAAGRRPCRLPADRKRPAQQQSKC
jgi:hypothetical protein